MMSSPARHHYHRHPEKGSCQIQVTISHLTTRHHQPEQQKKTIFQVLFSGIYVFSFGSENGFISLAVVCLDGWWW